MSIVNLGKIVFGALVSSLTLSDIVEHQMKDQDINVEPPIDSISIILCTYNEASSIEQCLQSLKHQSIIQQYPQYFELIMADSGSTDNTVELAKISLKNDDNIYKYKIISTGRGKLTARNIGTDYSSGNIIVAVDADTIYPYQWLNTLLKPFSDPHVMAVHGSTFDYTIPNVPGQFYTLATYLSRKIIRPNQMTGRNSAYYKHLFYKLGKFDETINQTDVKEMLKEEEYSFGEKLSQFGKVVYKMNASCIHLGGERLGCRIGMTNKELCDQYGVGIKRFG